MCSQVTSSNLYLSPRRTLWPLFTLSRAWLDNLPNLLRPKATPLDAKAAPLGGLHSQDRWVQVAILFTDIAGFSTILAHLPRPWQEQVLRSLSGEYYDLLRQCVRACGGRVDKFIGDGMMAVFRDPGGAVRAAWQIQKHVARLNTRQEQRGCPSFPTRTAIDSGWVIRKNLGTYWRREQTYLGNAVNTASHLAEVGQPGQVLISQATFEQMPIKETFRRWEPPEGVEIGVGVVAYELGGNPACHLYGNERRANAWPPNFDNV